MSITAPTPQSTPVEAPEIILHEITRLASIYREMCPHAKYARIVLRPRSPASFAEAEHPGVTVHGVQETVSILIPEEGDVEGWNETSGGAIGVREKESRENGLRGPPCNDDTCCEHSVRLNDRVKTIDNVHTPDAWHEAFQAVNSVSRPDMETKQEIRKSKREPDLWHEAFQNLSIRSRIVANPQEIGKHSPGI